MLTQLFVQHLAVVAQLALNINSGMTVLTGETGAGKSILIDALQLALGGRAESGIVRPNCSQAEISAVFELTHLPAVLEWLKEHALEAEGECIIRRTLTEDGRSRAYINGRVVPISQLRELGNQLVNIHGQHQHQSLLKPEHQRALLDAYAIAAVNDAKKTKSNNLLQHADLLSTVKKNYYLYQALLKEYQKLLSLQNQSDKLTLLQYQIQEIDELNLADDELTGLDAEHKHLAHAEQWLFTSEAALSALKNDSSQDATTLLYQGLNQVSTLKAETPTLTTAHELLNTAYIQLTEAILEIESFKKTLSSDPNRLMEIDKRLSQIHALARKHRIQPHAILEHKKILEIEAEKLLHIHTHLEEITEKLADAEKAYLNAATTLSASRQKAALILEKQVTQCIQTLEMPNGHFKISFATPPENPENNNAISGPHGIDDIEFLVSTNPGLALQPLRKIASGGELSRISLAIQVITTQKQSTPTLIFDEVDAGISGKTAETVGKLLRQLSKDAQVLCVTHLPQIAVQGHQHFNVLKTQTKDSTTTAIVPLSSSERIQELARMLGGALITERTLAHAEEMLESV